MRSRTPWDGVIPESDMAVMSAVFGPVERAMQSGQRPALIIVDMTKAFVEPRYRTTCGASAGPAVDATAQLLQSCRSAGIQTFFTHGYAVPTYRPHPSERGRWRAPASSALYDDLPPGDVIVDAVAPTEDDIVICKAGRPSAFFGTSLTSMLTYHNTDTVILAGMTTSGCVRATAVDAFQAGYKVLVPYECVADRSQISHQVSLFDLHAKYADVVELAEVQSYLRRLRTVTPSM